MRRDFTISEFAALRNININCLRYYEKIGILKPARVDPKTGYRYYAPEQLPILDLIRLCIDFGMPLKDLTAYIREDAFINNKELFETGRTIVQERIRALQTELDKIEYTLQYMTVNQQYCDKAGLYERTIPERTVVTRTYAGDLADVRQIELASCELYRYAQEKRLAPVFPAGLLIRPGDQPAAAIFFEIVGGDTADAAVRTLPAGDFLCRQVDLLPPAPLPGAIEAAFGAEERAEVIVSNILFDQYPIGTRKSELQKRIGP